MKVSRENEVLNQSVDVGVAMSGHPNEAYGDGKILPLDQVLRSKGMHVKVFVNS